MTKFATQMLPSTSAPPPPPNLNPLPSQPLPNPKGGINVVEKGDEKKGEERCEDRMEWEVEEESKAQVEVEKEDVTKEVVEEEQVKEASKEEVEVAEEYRKLCLTTVFEGEKVHKPILPANCEDPGPCLVTCEDIFTTADMGIVSIAGIAEDVVVKIGSLTVPADFHVIRSTKHSKGGTPQLLLGRPTLQTVGFKLDYITNAFSFKVGNIEEIYHPRKPSAASKKSAHQVQLSKEDKDEREQSEEAKARLKKLKGLRSSPPHVKKKGKTLQRRR
ncbi:hypothetical protein PIB30_082184 [Stylosanthes scabra]|uniref:Uncharacterized protein n=1 Tax=Stylosanthes scabra TaxID=79078 RepID=A0ABU6TRH2_9FABA|nr:hypothetical protein [Stylosanthes scabra]